MNKKELKEIWGEKLFNAFADHIDQEGWLMQNWGPILEDNYSDWDEDYNDTNEKSNLYSTMYLQDFEEKKTESGIFIRPKK
ncbi:hypothetical protein [Chryseobacterium indologenes]|uniref:Uncharacterized protein n=1 Tax=Chryseobacterium indologenes TaxID=253 RepID=A0A0N0IV38_CHRID|nr:hypothetical protein [Chryseobacterium indologenes]KPE50134.1 hypothetical protein AOB46_16990 [Chryseobacterium indologenes]